ncbi:unnamed protein product [marine sediment metagenome]|uniref:Uncharacterized protein n=1 Tax=marine sediment metagenome TaxID=412755 RepID=X1LKG2_9ZZZZ
MMSWLKTKANDLLTEYGLYAADALNARNELYTAGDNIAAENWDAAKDALYAAADDWGRAVGHIAGAPPWGYGCSYQLRDIFYWLEDNWPTNGDDYVLTATKICEAWAKDEFHDRALTIAFIDRMRQLIWDEPFYVAWAARPKV